MKHGVDFIKLYLDGLVSDKPQPFSVRDDFFSFPREVYLFGKYSPKEVGTKIDFSEIGRRCMQAIQSLGCTVVEIPIEGGTSEDGMEGLKGRYVAGDGKGNEGVLLARRYYSPGSESWENAESYDQEFLRDHWNQNYPESWRNDHLARLTHMAEDIVVHEYGHKVYRENFQEAVIKRPLETIFADKNPEIYRSLALVYSSDTEEGFARWLNFAIVGHEHPADIADLKMYSSEELRKEGKQPYNDRSAIADFYRLLKRTSDEHSIAYVIQNLPALAVDFIKAKHERKEKEREEEARKMGLIFEKYITITQPDKRPTGK